MAHIIGDDFEGKFIETEVEFTDGDQALEDFFARTPRAPGSILDATWFTGTPILPKVGNFKCVPSRSGCSSMVARDTEMRSAPTCMS